MSEDLTRRASRATRRKPDWFSTPDTLRQALYQLVHQSTLTVEQQADQLGLSPSYIYNAANPNLDDAFHYQLRHLIPHTKLTGNPCVVNFIEQQLGRVAVPVVQQMELYRPASMRIDLLGVATEFGEAAAALKKALADGKMTPAETKRFRKELWDVIQEAVLVYQEASTLEG